MPLGSFYDLPFFEPRHQAVRERIQAWLDQEPNIDDHDENDAWEQSRRFAKSLGKAGLLEYIVPTYKESANPNIDVRTICLLREALTYRSALADSAFVVQGLASAPFWQLGSERLRKMYLDGTRSGDLIPAFALSEPGGGSDVAATRTTATRDGDEFIIEGSKTWTSNAGIADYYLVIARTGEAPGAKGLSGFVVDADTSGFRVGDPIYTSAPHPMATIHFDGVRVPSWKMVGAPGDGFMIAMRTLDIFRATVGAASLGLAKRAFDETLARVAERDLFGKLMADMDTIQMKLADMATDVELAALTTYRAAWAWDHKGDRRTTVDASMAKLVGSEAAYRVVDEAVQLYGGLGVTRGCVVEHLFRDIRAMRIYEGASEIQRLIIGRAFAKQAKVRNYAPAQHSAT
ncbi:MAG: acyl-CoA dehydrogenase family protein [Pseudomonadota bacterium]